jgi:small conductance mechanosensitive channel
MKLLSRNCIQLCSLGIVVSFSTPLKAQETTKELTKQVAQINSTIVKKISQAIHGDVAAQQDLITNYLAPAVLSLGILFTCYMLASAIGRIAGGLVSQRVDVTLGRFLTKAIRILLMVLVGMALLEYNHISVSGLAAVLAAMSFAIGLALQGTLSNFAAGIMLMVFRPFKVDDEIVVSGIEGKVEEIDLFTTRINTADNRHIIIPNGSVFGNTLENNTRNSTRCTCVDVCTSYSADLQATRNALQYAVETASMSCEIAESSVTLTELGAHGVKWRVKAWTSTAEKGKATECLMEATKQALDAHGVAIAVPHLDIHMAGKFLAKAS